MRRIRLRTMVNPKFFNEAQKRFLELKGKIHMEEFLIPDAEFRVSISANESGEIPVIAEDTLRAPTPMIALRKMLLGMEESAVTGSGDEVFGLLSRAEKLEIKVTFVADN